MRASAGAAVDATCLDASPDVVALGCADGSVCVFRRSRRDDDAVEGPLRFLRRFHAEGAVPGEIKRERVAHVRIDPRGARCALAFDDGEVRVVRFSSEDHPEDPSRRSAGPPPGPGPGGALRASVVSSTHRGAKVTDVHWSPAGDALTCGDDRGVVSALLLDASDADSPEPAASVVRFGDAVAQARFLDDGASVAVSTRAGLFRLRRDASAPGTFAFRSPPEPVGSKPRDGPFGATPHEMARAAAPEGVADEIERDARADDADAEMCTSAEAPSRWLLGARPGRRLWVCHVGSGGDTPPSAPVVAATVRPATPLRPAAPLRPATPPKIPDAVEEKKSGKKKKSSKWEFGALFPLGPCLLSVSDRAVAVVDVVGAVVLAWYPVAASGGRKKEAEAAAMKRVRSCAASGARAFALFDDGEIGCLHAPRDEEALVLASARVAAEVEARGDEDSADSDADEDADAGARRLERVASHEAAHARRMRARLDARARWKGAFAAASAAAALQASTPFERRRANEEAAASAADEEAAAGFVAAVAVAAAAASADSTPAASAASAVSPPPSPSPFFPVFVEGVRVDGDRGDARGPDTPPAAAPAGPESYSADEAAAAFAAAREPSPVEAAAAEAAEPAAAKGREGTFSLSSASASHARASEAGSDAAGDSAAAGGAARDAAGDSAAETDGGASASAAASPPGTPPRSSARSSLGEVVEEEPVAWWTLLLGCDGCQPVRVNKRKGGEKSPWSSPFPTP